MTTNYRYLFLLPLLLLASPFATRAEVVSPLMTWVDSLTIGGQELLYDKKGDRYFLVIPESAPDEASYEAEVFLKCSDEIDIYIGSSHLKDGATITLNKPGFGKTFKITVYQNWKSIYSSTIETTTLPIVIIGTGSSNISRTKYTDGTFRMLCPNQSHSVPDKVCAKYRIRGATSANYPKKSYNLKFFDETGEKEDRTILGMRDDISWILDAMTIDKACVRNRLAMDLWNSYATMPYYFDREKKVRTGTRGHYVEVFLNDSYHGLYCLSEKIDRKQLRLKKSTDATSTTEEQIHGLLYKATQWNWTVKMGVNGGPSKNTPPPSYDNNANTGEWLDCWEIKYPDYETQRIDWGPLWNLINFCCMTDQDYFESNVASKLDLPVLLDYWLLIEISLAWDNDGKNMYYFCYDACDKRDGTRMSIAPWDLDATWGRAWNGLNDKQKDAEMDYRTTRKQSSGGIIYYNKLEDSETYDWEGMIRDRYHELRSNGLVSKENLLERLETYAELFYSSGARMREEKRWSSEGYHEDINADIEYMRDWISRRIVALDHQYGYDPATSGAANVEAPSHLQVEGGYGTLTAHAASPIELFVYNAGGQLVRHIRLTSGVTTIYNLSPGIYIANGQKVLIR